MCKVYCECDYCIHWEDGICCADNIILDESGKCCTFDDVVPYVSLLDIFLKGGGQNDN